MRRRKNLTQRTRRAQSSQRRKGNKRKAAALEDSPCATTEAGDCQAWGRCVNLWRKFLSEESYSGLQRDNAAGVAPAVPAEARWTGPLRWVKLSSLRQGLALSVLIFTINALGSPAHAQVRAQLSQAIDDAGYVRIGHTKPLLATPANDAGRVESSRTMQRMLLVLSPAAEQENQLKQLLDEQQNRKSPQYHHWLSANEYAAQFGVADADVEKVKQWLQGRGFTVAQIAKSKRWVEFSGTSQQVEQAFHTEMHYFKVGEQQYVANATDLAIPNALAEISGGVVSLNSFGKASAAAGCCRHDEQRPGDAASRAAATTHITPGRRMRTTLRREILRRFTTRSHC